MLINKKKVYALVAGLAVLGLVSVGIVKMTRNSAPVEGTAVQGAIGEREVYRDSKPTGTSVNAASSKEFNMMYRLGQIKALANNPDFKKLQSDAAFQALLESKEFQRDILNGSFSLERNRGGSMAMERVFSSKEFQNLMADSKFVESMATLMKY